MRYLWLAVLAGSCVGLDQDVRMPAGVYSGSVPGRAGLLQLEIYPDGTAIFRNVVTVHLPPAEVETLATSLVERGSAMCLEPSPTAVESCLQRLEGGGFVLRLRGSKEEAVLKFGAEVQFTTAPPATPKS